MAHSKIEFELKLVGSPGDVSAARALREIAEAGEGAWTRLEAIYFDTPARELDGHGFSIRVRREGAIRLLCAKRRRKGEGSARRDEVERPMAAADTETALLGEPEFDAALAPYRHALQPTAYVASDNWSTMVKRRGARIEAAFDVGRAGESRAAARPFAEIELELVSGDPRALFELAGVLIDAFPGRLHLSNETKLERARRGGGPPPLGDAGPIALDQDATLGAAMTAAFRAAGLRIIATTPHVCHWRDLEGARQLRAALRRFRVAERVFRKAANDRLLRAFAGEARAAARAVGEARDLDLFLAMAPALFESAEIAKGRDDLIADVESLRAAAWDKAARLAGDAALQRAALRMLEYGFVQPRDEAFDQPAAPFAARRLDRLRSRLIDAGAAVDWGKPETVHDMRLGLKKLRYAAQIFRGLYPGPARKAYFAAMSALQDACGTLNDAVIAQEIAERAAERGAPARAAGFIVGYKNAEARLAARAIEPTWRAFAATTPFWRA